MALLPQVLAELNATLGGSAGGREVKHVAWLAEQVRVCVPGDAIPGWHSDAGEVAAGAALSLRSSPIRHGWTVGGSSGGRC